MRLFSKTVFRVCIGITIKQVHPYVLYIKEGETLKNLNFVAISSIRQHDAVTWRVFQTQIIEYIKKHHQFIEKVIYFSDGAVSQYKNKKNFINLSYHEEDYGLKAEWNFFATSHGKGPCDGIGGTVKRLARRHCLQHPNVVIKTAEELYSWADKNIKNIKFFYSEPHLYNETLVKYQERFNSAIPIKGTQKLHKFIPLDTTKIFVKETSNSSSQSIVSIIK